MSCTRHTESENILTVAGAATTATRLSGKALALDSVTKPIIV